MYLGFYTGKRFCVPRNGAQQSRFGNVRARRGVSPSFETVVSNEVRGKGAARGPIAARRVKPKTIFLF
nr:hypothetical protein [uncultured Agathobaculum sp.]